MVAWGWLGPAVRGRKFRLKTSFDTLRRQHEAEAAGTARKTRADPNAYGLAALNDGSRQA